MQTGLKSRFPRVRKWLRRAFTAMACLFVLAWIGIRFVPVPEVLLRKPPESLELTDRHGTLLRETRISDRFQRQVELKKIPRFVQQAMFAAEDKRFEAHAGVDWIATARSAWHAAKSRRFTSGASTITQQLIKISHPRPRTLATKCIEMATALRLEQLWAKDDILAAYLNRLDFGNLNFGINSASWYYFGKPPSDLSIAESALLAGLPLNPSRLNPHTNPDGAKRRRTTVLARMLENGWITPEQHEQALAEPLRFRPPARTFLAPHFIDLVLQDIADVSEKSSVGDIRPRLSGLHKTTLDLDLNRFIEQSLSAQLAKLRDHNTHDGAVVVLDNRSGEILGLVGSGNYFAPGTGEVNGATVPRSAGSTLKPVTYLLAFERGDTAATVLADIPTEFTTNTGPYRPVNYSRHCQGPVAIREALACSLNIPVVRLLRDLGGPLPLQRRLQSWGISTLHREPQEYGLGLTIGNAEIRLIELVNLFATVARFGEYKLVRLIPGMDHKMYAVARPTAPSVKPGHFWILADILSDNTARQPQFGAASPLRFDFPVACKTGTSTDFRDNWAVGYTPEFTVGVWVGNFDGSAMVNVSGVSGAGPVFNDVFNYLHRRFGTTWFPRPPGIIEQRVNPLNGLISSGTGSRLELFDAGSIPRTETKDDLDAIGRTLLPAEFASWVAGNENILRDRVAVRDDGNVHIVSPSPGSIFILDPDIPSSDLVPLLASKGNVRWQSDTLDFREQGGRTFALAREGEHRITAVDPESGTSTVTWIKIRSL